VAVALLTMPALVGSATAVPSGGIVPGGIGVLLVFGLVGAVVSIIGLRNPPFAAVLVLGAKLFRLALPQLIAVDPFVVAYAGLLASMGIWMWRKRDQSLMLVGPVELAMGLYVLWCIGSMILPHEYGPVEFPLDGRETEIPRFIVISTIIPFSMYVVGRLAVEHKSAVRLVLWAIVVFGAYSTAVSILQFHAPALVWPRYIVDAPNWEGRANGVLNQPVGNGIVLIIGFVVAMALANNHDEPRWRRILLRFVALASCYAIYLTHTRAAYLSFAIVLILGAFLAKQFRGGFIATIAITVLLTAVNWSTFTSSDRAAGGIGSENEIWDRLNLLATSFWAFDHKPWLGWGIGRFVAVNSYHHQQWSNDIPWVRGLGIASHFNELGILVELGILGLVLWLCVLIPLSLSVVRAYRDLPIRGITGKGLAFIALASLVTQIVSGSSADLRLLDFPSATVFLLVGMAVGERERMPRDVRPSKVLRKSNARAEGESSDPDAREAVAQEAS
jgi:O-antigen ligase